MIVGIVGLGFVGSAMKKSFLEKNITTVVYDKYKDNGIGTIDNVIPSNILFICLPSLYDNVNQCYDTSSIDEVFDILSHKMYSGIVVIKSTLEVNKTNELSNKYKNLRICHNPEFLSAISAYKDFHNQKHIVLGLGINITDIDEEILKTFYNTNYPNADISISTSSESESMKLMCNSFYASKIAIFNEYYLFGKKLNLDYSRIRELMIKNNWINPMHTLVPGTDGFLGFGGACLPKDTKAIISQMDKYNSPNSILKSIIKENEHIRDSKNN